MKGSRTNKHNGRSTLIIILLLVMIGGGLSGLYFWESYQRRQETVNAVQDDPYDVGPVTIQYNNGLYQMRDDQDYYLFMGLDKTTDMVVDPDSQINYQQADFLFLMVVDHSSKSYYGVHINRDTMAEIKKLGITGANLGTYIGQICLAHAYGTGGKDSCRNQVWAVSRYFYDLPIKHYVAMTMGGIPVLNDAVGGVTVHVTDDFSRADPTLVMGKDIRLKGEHALNYVRGRMLVADGTNLNRMKRQREFINGLYEQFSLALDKDDAFPLHLAEDLSDYILSDLTTGELSELSNSLRDYQFGTIYSVDGEAILNEETGFMEFYPDENSFRDLVVKLFFRRRQ